VPTYAQLDSEPEWAAQRTPPAMETELLAPLRRFYNLGPASIGAAGDNNHLYGRHRSFNWDRASRFCTNRSYGTSDPRDQGGDRDQYRAFDVGITDQVLYDASRRMDALVQSGRAPGVAEWFGTFDGRVVSGWYEGRPSTSDSSHLSHLHGGLWNESADDDALMRLLYQTITGTAPVTPQREDDDMAAFLAQDANGIAVVWTGAGDVLWRNISAVETVAAWNAAGVPGPFHVPSIGALGSPAPVAMTLGGGPTLNQIERVVDRELDEQSMAGADQD